MRSLSDLGFSRFDLPPGIDDAVDWGHKDRTWALVVPGRRDVMEPAFERLRAHVNARYKMPRALRFVAPHMLVVGVIDGPDEALERWVTTHPNSTIWGGEVFHLLLVDPGKKRVVVGMSGGRVGAMRHLMFRPDQFGEALLP
jgi:hypothetical protein